MFSRKACYFFVRPKRQYLELCVFLGRAVNAPQVRRVERSSKTKLVHFIRIRHRDEVEAPITDWLREAYDLPDMVAARAEAGTAEPAARSDARRAAARTRASFGKAKRSATTSRRRSSNRRSKRRPARSGRR
jgi:hypothetical protein